jgi:hypothetical protein
MKGSLRSSRVLARTQTHSGTLARLTPNIRNNPFLGLSAPLSPKLRLAYPGTRTALASPTAQLFCFEELRPKRKLNATAGGVRLKPIKIVRAPRLQSPRGLKANSPTSLHIQSAGGLMVVSSSRGHKPTTRVQKADLSPSEHIQSSRQPKAHSPSSPRPIRTPSFSEKIEVPALPAIRRRSIAFKKGSEGSLQRVTSLKTLKPVCISLKRAQLL